jgi:hypothetical protein
MRFKYVGDQAAVDIPALGVTVERNHEVEVTGERAQEFLKRDDWTRTDTPKPKEPPPEEPPVEPEPEAASEGGEG